MLLFYRVVKVKSEEQLEVALFSISSHPLNTNEFCVCGRDYNVRTYDKRMCGQNPLKHYNPFRVCFWYCFNYYMQ